MISKDDINAMAHTKEQKQFWEVPMKVEVGKTYVHRVRRKSLPCCIGEDGGIWDYEEYEECETDSCFDGCSEDFVHYGKHFTEEEQEALAEEYEEQLDNDEWQGRYEWLEERGFESLGCNWQIHGGIEAVESDHDVYV